MEWDTVCSASDHFNEYNDCTVKAISIAFSVPYAEAHEVLEKFGRKPRKGPSWSIFERAVIHMCNRYGLKLRKVNNPRQRTKRANKYTAITVHKLLPHGRHILAFRAHVGALVDGEVIDWTHDRRKAVTHIYSLVEV